MFAIDHDLKIWNPIAPLNFPRLAILFLAIDMENKAPQKERYRYCYEAMKQDIGGHRLLLSYLKKIP